MTRIVLIEDDNRTAQMIKLRFNAAGYDLVTIADSLERARAYFRESTCDLVLLDLNLPDGDGVDLIPTIRAKASPPTILVMTSVDIPERIHAAMMGAQGCLFKDEIADDCFWLAVRALLSGDNHWSSRSARMFVQQSRKSASDIRVTSKSRSGQDCSGSRSPHRACPDDIGAECVELGSQRIVVADPAMKDVFAHLQKLAPSSISVLICGETGVGKENAALAVHYYSPRRTKRFVVINCGAIPESLAESELFGHNRGAFTGAVGKPGLLEVAAGGTVFLDEVGELPLVVQAKLLRVIDKKCFMRVGDTAEREIDIRVVAATNRSLHDEVKAGRFREDLRFRLCGATVPLPPLRVRPLDIKALARWFLREECRKLERSSVAISPEAMQVLLDYSWPGNVRELQSLMALIAAELSHDRLEPADLPPWLNRPSERGVEPTIAEAMSSSFGKQVEHYKQSRIMDALKHCGGNQTKTAKELGMSRRTLVALLRKWRTNKPKS